jgi:hypothetical protein
MTLGPPYIDLFISNIQSPQPQNLHIFRASRLSINSTVDRVVSEIGELLKSGEFKLYSLNATKYAVSLFVITEKGTDHISALLDGMKRKLWMETEEFKLMERRRVSLFLVIFVQLRKGAYLANECY